MSENKVTVAELLARRRAESGDASTRPRRRRSADEGGVSVSELTGSIPVVEGIPHHDRHSSAGDNDELQNTAAAENEAAPATTDASDDSLTAETASTSTGGAEPASSTAETVDGASADSDATAADNPSEDHNELSTEIVDNSSEAVQRSADGVDTAQAAPGDAETSDDAPSVAADGVDTTAESNEATELVQQESDADETAVDSAGANADASSVPTDDTDGADANRTLSDGFGGSFAQGDGDDEPHPHTGSDFGALPADLVASLQDDDARTSATFSEEASAAIAQTPTAWDTTEHESSLSAFGGHDEHSLTAEQALAGFTATQGTLPGHAPAPEAETSGFAFAGGAAILNTPETDSESEFSGSFASGDAAASTDGFDATATAGEERGPRGEDEADGEASAAYAAVTTADAPEAAAAETPAADAEGAEDTEDAKERVSIPVVILEVIVAMAVGVGIFKGFERLWEGFAIPMTALLALAVTLALVGVVHAVVRERDKLMMFFAFIVGVALTCGPYLLVN